MLLREKCGSAVPCLLAVRQVHERVQEGAPGPHRPRPAEIRGHGPQQQRAHQLPRGLLCVYTSPCIRALVYTPFCACLAYPGGVVTKDEGKFFFVLFPTIPSATTATSISHEVDHCLAMLVVGFCQDCEIDAYPSGLGSRWRGARVGIGYCRRRCPRVYTREGGEPCRKSFISSVTSRFCSCDAAKSGYNHPPHPRQPYHHSSTDSPPTFLSPPPRPGARARVTLAAQINSGKSTK